MSEPTTETPATAPAAQAVQSPAKVQPAEFPHADPTTGIQIGDTVHVVTVRGEHPRAQVVKVRGGGVLDLEFEHEGKTMMITSSRIDPTGKKHDCWYPRTPAQPRSAA